MDSPPNLNQANKEGEPQSSVINGNVIISHASAKAFRITMCPVDAAADHPDRVY